MELPRHANWQEVYWNSLLPRSGGGRGGGVANLQSHEDPTNASDTPSLLATAAVAAAPRLVRAQAPTIRIGVLNDQSGQYRDDGGPTGVVCARQALVDFGIAGKGFNVEIIAADHQNKPDVGASIARQWFDQNGVDAIVDVPTSSVGLAVNTVCREKNKVMLNSGTGTPT